METFLPDLGSNTQSRGEPFQSMECLVRATPVEHHSYSMEAARVHNSSRQWLGSQSQAAQAVEPMSSLHPAPTPTYCFPQSLLWSGSQSAVYIPNDVSTTQSTVSSSVSSLTQNTLSQYEYVSHLAQSLQWPGPQSAAYTTNNLPPAPTVSPVPPPMIPFSLTENRGFKCDACGKKYVNKQNLEGKYCFLSPR